MLVVVAVELMQTTGLLERLVLAAAVLAVIILVLLDLLVEQIQVVEVAAVVLAHLVETAVQAEAPAAPVS